VIDMTQKDPNKRLSASDYLKILMGKSIDDKEREREREKEKDSSEIGTRASSLSALPEYFDSCIYPLYLKLHWNGVTPDDRIKIICEVSLSRSLPLSIHSTSYPLSLSIYLSFFLSFYLCIYLSFSLSLSIYLSIFLSLSFSFSLSLFIEL
jgi:hypothetical protein